MTQALPSTIKAKEKLRSWVAVGGLSGLRTTVSKAGRELSWVLLGKFCLMGANAGLMLFLANRLDLNTYGLLVITISAQLLISRLLMLGVDAGIVRLTAMSDLRSLSREVVSAGLVAIICTSTILLVLVLLITPVLSILGIPVWLIACITAGSIGTSFVDYGYSFRLARHEYAFAAVTQGGTAIWRLALTTLASVILVAHPIAVFVAYHAASFVSGLAQAFLIFARKWQQPGKALTRRLLGYSFWQAKANVTVIFCLYQGTFFLMLLKERGETGIFGLGLTLSLGFFAIYNAYFEYLLTRIRLVQRTAVQHFVTRSLLAASLLVLACVPIVLALLKVIALLGPERLQVVATFVYLSASMMILILQAPLEAACHYALKPQIVSIGWLIRAVVSSVATLILEIGRASCRERV